ncbi:Uu.00g052490.m01.CDS01 [Anthostomella pinea]|uniref:Uu.00g052490.m01.CDS01 n=1 Tax=Anthostomella pinea TaxID=933095 RepID=A0AAI8VW90_9PEZI|nr:Uu.00g052490.m01.CDS01 [Anthostomella pinea]
MLYTKNPLTSLAGTMLSALLLFSSLAQAVPLSPESAPVYIAKRAVAKRIILWDYSLTRDLAAYPAIQASANSLANSPVVTTIVNWETWRPTELHSNLQFEPTVRTPAYLSGDDWNRVLSASSSTQGLMVHLYNEPERQSVSVADALAAWRNTMLPLRAQHGVKLSSPACAADAAGTAWLDSFMSQLSAAEKPDFVGIYFYADAAQNAADEVQSAQDYLNTRHTKFGIPIVILEMASTSRDFSVMDTFTRQMVAWLDGQDWVNKYGFFGVSREPVDSFVSPAAQLMDVNGAWTALGHFFTGV